MTKADKKELINQVTCMNAEIKRGREGGRIFPPNRDLGTENEVRLGKKKLKYRYSIMPQG